MPLQPSAAIPGPVEFPDTEEALQSGVKLAQSLLSVPFGPPAQGTQVNVASHPAAVPVPSDKNAKVKQPLASVDWKLNGVAGLPVRAFA